MNHELGLPIPAESQAFRSVTRREMLQKTLTGLGATLAGSATAMAHPMYKYLSDPTRLEGMSAKVDGKDWSPGFLDDHQNASVVALAEGILPGSTLAQVNRMIDLLLTVDTEENRKKFAAALAAFDTASTKHFGHPVQLLKSSELNEMLAFCSRENSGRSTEDNDFAAFMKSLKAQVGSALDLGEHFENIKGWIVATYYASEIGMRELGWTEHVFFSSPAVCSHSESHAGPAQRASQQALRGNETE